MKTKINHLLGAVPSPLVTFGSTFMHNAVRTLVAMASLGVALYTTPALAQVWQASTDYSDTQGYRNWHYMFFNTLESVYGPLVYGYHNYAESWHGSDGLGDLGVDIFSSVIHPGGRGHEAARVWESPIAGTVRVTGRVAEADGSPRNPAFPGDGVRATIWKNDELLFSVTIADLDLIGFSYDLVVHVMPGDWLIFRSGAGDNPYYDATYFDPMISVDPVPAIENLAIAVLEMNLQNGIENSLDSKLDAALDALRDANLNNDGAACNSLAAFINAVEAQRGNKITSAQADQLIASAQQIQATLNCGN